MGSAEDAVGWDSTVWHKASWIVAGSPTEYRGASKHAPDQGYFLNDSEHHMPGCSVGSNSHISHVGRICKPQ